MKLIFSSRSSPLLGSLKVPGDKSISHRSLIISSMAVGNSTIKGLLESEDVLATVNALKLLGIKITVEKGNVWNIYGAGLSGYKEPREFLDLGNSGTGVRLLMGAISGSNIKVSFKGDESLSKRPMMRIIKPLMLMGNVFTHNREALPVTISSPKEILSIKYKSPVASAQIKSAILLAGLSASGITEVIEPKVSREHTEKMLIQFGAEINSKHLDDGSNHIKLNGRPLLKPQEIVVPGDPSSAAFPIVAALITPGSKIEVKDVMINPGRDGFIKTLLEMGAKITIKNKLVRNNETIASILAEYSNLKGIVISSNRVATMIDEYPIISIAASSARGTTKMLGISELRVKETDRIHAVAKGLKNAGIKVDETKDSLSVHGGVVKGGCNIDSQLDHRIAMSFIILGLISKNPIKVNNCHTIATSFPSFVKLMKNLGANIEKVNI